MKVKDFLKKVNVGRLDIPVYLREGALGKSRKAWGPDFNGGYSDEADRTVVSIDIKASQVTVFYK